MHKVFWIVKIKIWFVSPSLSDFAMTRDLKQLAGTTYNDSLLELGELLQDIMQSPQMVQMFLLSPSEKSSYDHIIAFAFWKPLSTRSWQHRGKKPEKKLSSVVAHQCGFQLGWQKAFTGKVNLNNWNMRASFSMVFKNLLPSGPFNVHFHCQGVNIKLGFTVVWSDRSCCLLFCSR